MMAEEPTTPRTAVVRRAKGVSFEDCLAVVDRIHRCEAEEWTVFVIKGQSFGGCDQLEISQQGHGRLRKEDIDPSTFSQSALWWCLCNFIEDGNVCVVSCCWKGNSLAVSSRLIHHEYHKRIQDFLHADLHVNLRDFEEIARLPELANQAPRRSLARERSFLGRAQFADEVAQAKRTVQTATNPFNWMICGYDHTGQKPRLDRIVLNAMGQGGLEDLQPGGAISEALVLGRVQYIYVKVDIPMEWRPDDTVAKYVLITWKGVSSKGSYVATSALSTGAVSAHNRDVFSFFPHHVHYSAYTVDDLSEEHIRERLRRAIDNDALVLRVVYIERNGYFRPPIALEMSRDATMRTLKMALERSLYLPADQQRVLWIKTDKEALIDGKWSPTPRSKAVFLDDPSAKLMETIGLVHGDKLFVDDVRNGDDGPLPRLANQTQLGNSISNAAMRRADIERGMMSRHSELKSALLTAAKRLRKKTEYHLLPSPLQSPTPLTPAAMPPPSPAAQSSSEDSEGLSPDTAQVASPRRNSSATDGRKDSSASAARNAEGTSDKPSSDGDIDELGGVTAMQKRVSELSLQTEYLEIPYESIRILSGRENELGMGKNASVYRGLWYTKDFVSEVAVKKFRYHRLTDTVLAAYRMEVGMLRKLNHPNIMLFIGACTKPTLMILTEYCSRGSLYKVIQDTEVYSQIPWMYKIRMMLDAARGMSYLHGVSVMHRDIKSHNLLVDDDWRVKVADFGISKVVNAEERAHTQVGTTGWVAPEVLVDEEEGYTFKADIWSFAIVMWEMVAGENKNDFIGMAAVKYYKQLIEQEKRPIIPPEVDANYQKLIFDCWKSQPEERPSFSQIVERLEAIGTELSLDISLPPIWRPGHIRSGSDFSDASADAIRWRPSDDISEYSPALALSPEAAL